MGGVHMNDAAPDYDLEYVRGLEAAVLKMPKKRRGIFLARRLDKLPYAKISSITGLSERRIEKEMAKAICQLSKAMSQKERRTWRWSRSVWTASKFLARELRVWHVIDAEQEP